MMNFRVLLPFLTAGMVACSNGNQNTAQTEVQPAAPAPTAAAAPEKITSAVPVTAPAANRLVLHSLTGSGLKFNGVYDSNTNGDIHYFIRFFERGSAVLVAGRQRPDDELDLRTLLKIDAKSGENNIHNVPVEQRGDSLFFTTMAIRGAIIYSGIVAGDSLRFLKHSKATGKRAVVNYGFIPDGAPVP